MVVASALHRMDVYADTYGLTRLRLLVALCEVWFGLVFLMVLVAGIRLRAAWLARAVVAAGVLALLGLAAANPDGLIADRNIDPLRADRPDRRELPGRPVGRRRAGARPAAASRSATACWPRSRSADARRRTGASWSYGREHARRAVRRQPAGDAGERASGVYRW